mmetsp:Transcript_293/g.724  ORF Transcript_293/g.724 Transcript_293/m.724 type:complete len:237 (-) Transcript_293:735-1445(-)
MRIRERCEHFILQPHGSQHVVQLLPRDPTRVVHVVYLETHFDPILPGARLHGAKANDELPEVDSAVAVGVEQLKHAIQNRGARAGSLALGIRSRRGHVGRGARRQPGHHHPLETLEIDVGGLAANPLELRLELLQLLRAEVYRGDVVLNGTTASQTGDRVVKLGDLCPVYVYASQSRGPEFPLGVERLDSLERLHQVEVRVTAGSRHPRVPQDVGASEPLLGVEHEELRNQVLRGA